MSEQMFPDTDPLRATLDGLSLDVNNQQRDDQIIDAVTDYILSQAPAGVLVHVDMGSPRGNLRATITVDAEHAKFVRKKPISGPF